MKEYILIAGLVLFAAQSNADGLVLSANDVQDITTAAKNVLTEADVIGEGKGAELVDSKEEANLVGPKEKTIEPDEEKVIGPKG